MPAGLTLHAATGLIYGSTSTLGIVPVTIHATNTLGTGSETVTINIGSVAQGLADALDAPALTVASSGDLAWTPQQLYTHDGNDAARSGLIDNLQQSVMTTQVDGPCKVIFYWGISSEADYDFLRFSIDDVEQEAISGEVGWTRKSFLLSAGTHALKWAYIKDDFVRSGLDSGFVDQLEFHTDNDGDGIYSDTEAWFGTSDNNAGDFPRPAVSRTASSTTLQFPSVSGQDYRIEYSDDLKQWTPVIVTATGSSTTWPDPTAGTKPRRFYRVEIP